MREERGAEGEREEGREEREKREGWGEGVSHSVGECVKMQSSCD